MQWLCRAYPNDIADTSSLYAAITTNRAYAGLTHPMVYTELHSMTNSAYIIEDNNADITEKKDNVDNICLDNDSKDVSNPLLSAVMSMKDNITSSNMPDSSSESCSSIISIDIPSSDIVQYVHFDNSKHYHNDHDNIASPQLSQTNKSFVSQINNPNILNSLLPSPHSPSSSTTTDSNCIQKTLSTPEHNDTTLSRSNSFNPSLLLRNNSLVSSDRSHNLTALSRNNSFTSMAKNKSSISLKSASTIGEQLCSSEGYTKRDQENEVLVASDENVICSAVADNAMRVEEIQTPVLQPYASGYIPDVTSRYWTEDLPCHLILAKTIAHMLGNVETPIMDKVILWMQSHMNQEYMSADGKHMNGKDMNLSCTPLTFNLTLDDIMLHKKDF